MEYRNSEHYYDPTPAEAYKRMKRKGKQLVKNKIFAIDPGTKLSGYVIVQHDGKEITHVLEKGKVANEEILHRLPYELGRCEIAVEMVASYGMPVGAEVFETCVWIGRFLQAGGISPMHSKEALVYRLEEKQDMCHSVKANDATIRQALIDRFAYGVPNKGKGTKNEPGFFHGFAADAWQAMAVAATYFDRRRIE